MSITRKLRNYARNYERMETLSAELIAIADRIDAEHEAACAEAYGNGVESVALPDMTAYVKLPVDADGVPIHIGDKVSESDYRPEGGVVVGMKLYQGWDHWLINCGAWVDPRNCRHVQPDSWERIIDDAAKNIYPNGAFNPCWDEVRAELVERCRRLANEQG